MCIRIFLQYNPHTLCFMQKIRNILSFPFQSYDCYDSWTSIYWKMLQFNPPSPLRAIYWAILRHFKKRIWIESKHWINFSTFPCLEYACLFPCKIKPLLCSSPKLFPTLWRRNPITLWTCELAIVWRIEVLEA